MPLATNIRFWLKAVSGASSPVNFVTGSGAMSGGTISLVDRGSGVFAWRFTGLDSSALFTALGINTDGNGFVSPQSKNVVMALRMAVVADPTGNGFDRYAGFTQSTDIDNGMYVMRNGAANNAKARAPNIDDETASIGNPFPVGGAPGTVVIQLKPGTTGQLDTIRAWRGQVGRVGTAPDAVGGGGNFVNSWMAMQRAVVRPGGGTLDVVDLVLFDATEDYTDAELAALADLEVRGVLDAAPATSEIGGSATGDEGTASGGMESAAELGGSATGDEGSAAGGMQSAAEIGGAATGDEGSASGGMQSGSPGTVTSEPLTTNNGTLLANVALNFVALYDQATGALVVRKTGLSTNSAGVYSFTDAAVVQGTVYRHDYETVDGHRRMPLKAAV